eukprot:1326034-Rhodomonas_salina.1
MLAIASKLSKHTRAEDLKEKWNDAFSVVFSIQSQPMDTNNMKTVFHTKNRLEELASLLQDNQLGKVCLTDASTNMFDFDIKLRKMRTLVWSGMGDGWERSQLLQQLTLDGLIKILNTMDPLPLSLVVCYKYGPKAAAHRIIRETKISTTLLYDPKSANSLDPDNLKLLLSSSKQAGATSSSSIPTGKQPQASREWCGIEKKSSSNNVTRQQHPALKHSCTEVEKLLPVVPETNFYTDGSDESPLEILAGNVASAAEIKDSLEHSTTPCRLWVRERSVTRSKVGVECERAVVWNLY